MNELKRFLKIFSKIEFNPREHVYTLEGKTLPSVTQILSKLKISPIYPDSPAMKWYAARGKRVHKYLEFARKGKKINISKVDPVDRGYVEAGLKFLADFSNVFDSLAQEQQVFVDSDTPYAGTIDEIIFVKKTFYDETLGGEIPENSIIVVDDKTSSSIHESYFFQIAAYAYALKVTSKIHEEVPNIFGMIRQLKSDGSYFIKMVPLNKYEELWEKAVLKFYHPRKYKYSTDSLVNNRMDIPEEIARKIITTKQLEREIKKTKEDYNQQLKSLLYKEGFIHNGIWEGNSVQVIVTWVEPKDIEEKIDWNKVKEHILSLPEDSVIRQEFINIIRQYTVTKPKGGYFRTTLKEKKEEKENDNNNNGGSNE